MKKKQIFIALALAVAIGGAFSTKANSRAEFTTYYDQVTGPNPCDVTNCGTNSLHTKCTQQFFTTASCGTTASVTLYLP